MGMQTLTRFGGFGVAVLLSCGGLLVACAGTSSEPAPVVMGAPATAGEIAAAGTSAPLLTNSPVAPRTTTRAVRPAQHTALTHPLPAQRMAAHRHHRSTTASASHRKHRHRAVAHRAPDRKHAKTARKERWISPPKA
jgi:hypothetical protein